MDFRLPLLEWQGSVWRLPLREESAARFVAALLDEPEIAKQRLVELLTDDPALLLWVVCRAPSWRAEPPQDPLVVADWLLHAAVPGGQLEPLDAHPDSDRDRSSQPEQREIDVGHGSCSTRHVDGSVNWAVQALRGARSIWGDSGPPIDGPTIQDCPWLPDWLRWEESEPPIGRDTPSIAEGGNGEAMVVRPGIQAEIASRLPRVVQLVRRLHTLESQFDAAVEREKIAAMRELAYGASHEINNPLANIATRAQSLLREESHPERKRKLATIAAQAFRAYEMIADMMLFAKPPVMDRQPVDVASVVESMVREMQTDAAAQETQLCFERCDPLVVPADATQLGVAVKALVRNSLEALTSGGTVRVCVRGSGPDSVGLSWAEIEVADTGPGISPDVRRHLFDPFYSGREAGRGLGFGLPKCWTIAQLHGGDIRVESEPGSGAVFTLRIPRC
jgi:signal transduction histidine kinase